MLTSGGNYPEFALNGGKVEGIYGGLGTLANMGYGDC